MQNHPEVGFQQLGFIPFTPKAGHALRTLPPAAVAQRCWPPRSLTSPPLPLERRNTTKGAWLSLVDSETKEERVQRSRAGVGARPREGQVQLEAEPQSCWGFPELSQRRKSGDGVVELGTHEAGMGRNVFKRCSQSQREPSQQQQQNYVSPDPKETLEKGGSRQEAGGGSEWA